MEKSGLHAKMETQNKKILEEGNGKPHPHGVPESYAKAPVFLLYPWHIDFHPVSWCIGRMCLSLGICLIQPHPTIPIFSNQAIKDYRNYGPEHLERTKMGNVQ